MVICERSVRFMYGSPLFTTRPMSVIGMRAREMVRGVNVVLNLVNVLRSPTSMVAVWLPLVDIVPPNTTTWWPEPSDQLDIA